MLSNSLPSSIDDILSHIKSQSLTVRDQGTAFEKLMCWWLTHDPVQRSQFSEVLSYADWCQKSQSKQDTGIDLVAKTHDGEYVAIQCKFYDPEGSHRITKDDINSFITRSGSDEFIGRIFIETTAKRWSEFADHDFNRQEKDTRKYTLNTLRESRVNWQEAVSDGHDLRVKDKKELRAHQQDAVDAVISAFSSGVDRGMMVMACGTGKTFTALGIAEALLASKKGYVLVLTPSLALVNQLITSWHEDTKVGFESYAVCSDSSIGKQKTEDILEIAKSELVIPATTNPQKLALAFHKKSQHASIQVIFATYHSIGVIIEAQERYQLPEFDLVIADEAHRTTGYTMPGDSKQDHSYFIKMHDQEILKARKRLYMTATPRIYSESAKNAARDKDAMIVSMDDPERYGRVLYRYGFSSALRDGLLSDYRVIILHLPQSVASQLSHSYEKLKNLTLDDATKIIGCWKGMQKIGYHGDDINPMKKVLAFTSQIKHSKNLVEFFPQVVEEYLATEADIEEEITTVLPVTMKHVDGGYSAVERGEILRWLAADADDECRVVSNVRCLAEGVDVPALDGLIFFHPKSSQQEVVQAVGRVMRKAPGKELGYIIIPVVTPDLDQAKEYLDQDEVFRPVTKVINALRSHDERLDAEIHAASLDGSLDHSNLLQVVGGVQIHEATDPRFSESLPQLRLNIGQQLNGEKSEKENKNQEINSDLAGTATQIIHTLITTTVVKHCGRKTYWPDWADDVGKMARNAMTRIAGLVESREDSRRYFNQFIEELRDDLNPSIEEDDATEMLGQHMVTKPIFAALFTGFAAQNPVSKSMDKILTHLDQFNVDSETRELSDFYDSVRSRAQSVKTSAGKQQLIRELYDQFFRKAFKKTTDILGIAYTPVEVVDFILRSVNVILQKKFNTTLSSGGVRVLDPFTGTGTFMARLFDLGLIAEEDLDRKYREELFANDIVLLAYYVA
ncbi:MAG: DEAD/DEAH box helicase family protein, partial [Proteobacteria bacterium]|nr:DEAD/DEAH box helicase family protein [Pseudomonadota bacterium]